MMIQPMCLIDSHLTVNFFFRNNQLLAHRLKFEINWQFAKVIVIYKYIYLP